MGKNIMNPRQSYLIGRPSRIIVMMVLVLSCQYTFAQRPIKAFLDSALNKTPPPTIQTLDTARVIAPSITPHMRGDTLEYNTANVKTRANATVEELLGRLPGVQVDPDGNITVNGQKIERLLVDGEDLFGSNPTIVTRNFNADMISKVQVLNKKSAEADFTGIDDGSRTKTLNLTLKDDSKRGNFLKAEAGGDTNEFYNVNGLFGSFKGARQLTALASMNNIGIVSSSNYAADGPKMRFGEGISDALGASAGTGIPRTVGTGIHYANKWGADGDHFGGNYSYGHLITTPFSISTIQQILPESVYIQQRQQNSINSHDQHAMDANYDWHVDSLSTFHFSITGSNMQGHDQFASVDSSSFNDTLANTSFRQIYSNVQDRSFQGIMMYRKRARYRRGRTFSFGVTIDKKENNTEGTLHSFNDFFKPSGSIESIEDVQQRKIIRNNGNYLSGSFNYTDALWKNAQLGLTYGLIHSSYTSLLSTFDISVPSNTYVDSMSSHYRNNVFTQIAGLSIQGKANRLTYGLGGFMQYSTNAQKDEQKHVGFQYDYLSFAPRLDTRWELSSNKGLDLSYRGATQQPSINQLQPVQNNNDPLHVMFGNPDLRPSFSHRMSFGYHSFKRIVLNVLLNYGLTTNSISTKTYTDTLGRQISQPVNVDGTREASLNLSLNKNIRQLGIDAGFTANTTYNRSVNYVNQYLSRNDNAVIGAGINLNKFVAERYRIVINSNVFYTSSHSSINTLTTIRYWTQIHNAQFSVFPLHGFEINTSASYNWRQRIDQFDKKNSTILWNAAILKDLFRNTLTIRWQINDILGQNAGIFRASNANQTTENRFNVMGRYWMISVSWRLMHHSY